MKKVFLFLFFLSVSGTLSAQSETIHTVPGQFIVMLQHGEPVSSFLQRVNQSAETRFESIETLSAELNIYLIAYDPAFSSTTAINHISKDPATALVQYNHSNVTERDTCPNDINFISQWALYNNGTNGGSGLNDIDACKAWDLVTGGFTKRNDRIVVAVIDGGFDLNHPDLNFYVNPGEIPGNSIDDDNNGYIDDVNGWNAILNNGNVLFTGGSDYHATHVSGIIGAAGNNSVGVSGVNWDVEILAVRGSTSIEATAVAAYAYVYTLRKKYNQTNGAEGAFVVSTNSSFGINNGDPAAYPIWCAMYDTLGKAGILSVAATANSSVNVDVVDDIPTACPSDWLVTVTNMKSDDTRAVAGYGLTTIDIGAPGTAIQSTLPNTSYGNLSGTSMASPFVAGTIALMWAAACEEMIDDYKIDPMGVSLIMKNFLMTNGYDAVSSLSGITVTGGRLNLDKAVRAVSQYTNCPIGVKESFSTPTLTAYPNPAEDEVVINWTGIPGGNYTFSLVNELGQVVTTWKKNLTDNGQFSFSMSEYSPGIYSFVFSPDENLTTFVIRIAH